MKENKSIKKVIAIFICLKIAYYFFSNEVRRNPTYGNPGGFYSIASGNDKIRVTGSRVGMRGLIAGARLVLVFVMCKERPYRSFFSNNNIAAKNRS